MKSGIGSDFIELTGQYRGGAAASRIRGKESSFASTGEIGPLVRVALVGEKVAMVFDRSNEADLLNVYSLEGNLLHSSECAPSATREPGQVWSRLLPPALAAGEVIERMGSMCRRAKSATSPTWDWEHELSCRIQDFFIFDDMVVASARDNTETETSAIDRATGSILWTRKLDDPEDPRRTEGPSSSYIGKVDENGHLVAVFHWTIKLIDRYTGKTVSSRLGHRWEL